METNVRVWCISKLSSRHFEACGENAPFTSGLYQSALQNDAPSADYWKEIHTINIEHEDQ